MKTIETVYTDFQTKGPLVNWFWNENVTATFWVWSFSLWRFKICIITSNNQESFSRRIKSNTNKA